MDKCKLDECTEAVWSRSKKRGFCYRHYWQDYHTRNKDKRNSQSAEWRSKNPDYWKNADPERKSIASKRYEESHRAERNEAERLRRIIHADSIRLARRTPKAQDSNRRSSHARRARLAGSISEDFTDEYMLEVYGTDCYLCLEPIDLDAPRHAAKGAGWERGLHREHVIALVNGGDNTLINCRPSHAICNLRKGRV